MCVCACNVDKSSNHPAFTMLCSTMCLYQFKTSPVSPLSYTVFLHPILNVQNQRLNSHSANVNYKKQWYYALQCQPTYTQKQADALSSDQDLVIADFHKLMPNKLLVQQNIVNVFTQAASTVCTIWWKPVLHRTQVDSGRHHNWSAEKETDSIGWTISCALIQLLTY